MSSQYVPFPADKVKDDPQYLGKLRGFIIEKEIPLYTLLAGCSIEVGRTSIDKAIKQAKQAYSLICYELENSILMIDGIVKILADCIKMGSHCENILPYVNSQTPDAFWFKIIPNLKYMNNVTAKIELERTKNEFLESLKTSQKQQEKLKTIENGNNYEAFSTNIINIANIYDDGRYNKFQHYYTSDKYERLRSKDIVLLLQNKEIKLNYLYAEHEKYKKIADTKFITNITLHDVYIEAKDYDRLLNLDSEKSKIANNQSNSKDKKPEQKRSARSDTDLQNLIDYERENNNRTEKDFTNLLKEEECTEENPYKPADELIDERCSDLYLLDKKLFYTGKNKGKTSIPLGTLKNYFNRASKNLKS